MKNLLIVFIALSMQLAASAQSVMGINLEIDSTINEFQDEMLKKGYEPFETIAGEQKYKVDFAGYQDCQLSVRYNQDNEYIYEVAIYMDDRTASEKEEIYEQLLKQFKTKYSNSEDEDVLEIMGLRIRSWHYKFEQGKRAGISLLFSVDDGEVTFAITYVTKYEKSNTVKPSDDI